MRLVLLSKNQNGDLDQDKTVPVREPGSSSEIMSSKYKPGKKKKIQAGSRPAWRAGRSLEAGGLREMGRDSQTHPASPSERGQAEAESWERVARLGHSRVPCGSAMPGEAPSSQAEEKQVQTGRWAIFPMASSTQKMAKALGSRLHGGCAEPLEVP